MSGRVPAAEAIAPLEEPLAAGLLGLEGADVLDNLRGQSRPIVGGPAVAGVIDGEVVRLRALGGFNRTTWQWLEQRTSSPAADTDATALAGDPFDATQRGACAAALQAPVRTLAFEPVPVDVPQAPQWWAICPPLRGRVGRLPTLPGLRQSLTNNAHYTTDSWRGR